MQSIISPWNYGPRLTTSLRDTENTGVAGGLWCKIYGCERADRTALWKRGRNTIFCLRLGPHGTILEILWFRLKLYQSLFHSPKPKLTINTLPVNVATVGRESSQRTCAALAWLLTVVNKVSFESSGTGLFTSISANKTEIFLLSCVLEPLKREKRSGRTRSVWLLHYADRTGGKLVHLESHRLLYAKVPCCAAAMSLSVLCCHGVLRRSLCQKIGTGCWGGGRLMILLQTNYLTCQKFIPPSDGWSGGNNQPPPPLHPDCCTGNDSKQNKRRPDAKMCPAARILGQKTVQGMKLQIVLASTWYYVFW